MRRSRAGVVVVGAWLFGAATGAAQQVPPRLVTPTPSGEVADRIVAVVGDRPILATQVDEQIFGLASQGQLTLTTKEDTARVRKDVLKQMIDDELLVQEAQRDTAVKVTEQEVADSVEKTLRGIRARFPTELEFKKELSTSGFLSADEYRRFLGDEVRRDFLKARLYEHLAAEGKLKPVQPTDAEMRRYFEERKGQFGKRPATIGFRQIIVAPRATEPARLRAKQLADSIVAQLRLGADFATAARRFSQDPGSREAGGDLGWNRRGSWVQEFERAAFSLRKDQISDPVESPFGWHIIQVTGTQPGEVRARHVLLSPELSEADADSARVLALRIAEQLKAGAPFDSLQALYHDKTEEREARDAPIDKLPAPYQEAIGNAQPDEVVGPFALERPGGGVRYAVLKIVERRDADDIQYEDVRERIRGSLGQQLAAEKFLERLRRATYIEIRGEQSG